MLRQPSDFQALCKISHWDLMARFIVCFDFFIAKDEPVSFNSLDEDLL
jgi:hypothetical protein